MSDYEDLTGMVIVGTEAHLVVSFAKFNEFTARAIAAGLGVE